jgi:hypothetical protein
MKREFKVYEGMGIGMGLLCMKFIIDCTPPVSLLMDILGVLDEPRLMRPPLTF